MNNMRSVEEIIKGAVTIEVCNNGPITGDGFVRITASIGQTLAEYSEFWNEQGEPDIGDKVELISNTFEFLSRIIMDAKDGDLPF